MNEIWKLWKEEYTVIDSYNRSHSYPAIYISNMGNIRGRNINERYGYQLLHYKGKCYLIHRLVLELFKPNPNPDIYIQKLTILIQYVVIIVLKILNGALVKKIVITH